MRELADKRIVLGLTGGIACYKAAEFVRRAHDQGAIIDVVMTAAATRFITPTTLQALSGRPVFVDPFDARIPDSMAHIHLTRGAAAIIVAPASTNFIARLAHGLADDLLAALCAARGPCPLLLAPAMNREMWLNPPTQRNIRQLKEDGVTILGPASGSQACGETGDGRMIEPLELLDGLIGGLQPKVLAGIRVVITAGPTVEAIDPVRILTNRSSGKTGFALARAACQAGASVVLIAGPATLPTPYGVQRIDVESAAQMRAAAMAAVAGADVFIAVAAVADWHVLHPSGQKLKKHDLANRGTATLDLRLAPNPDILTEVAALPNGPWCVGFAAETEKLEAHAQAKRARKGVDLMIGNLAQQSMGADDTQLVLFDDTGAQPLPRLSKTEAARCLIDAIAARLPRNARGRG